MHCCLGLFIAGLLQGRTIKILLYCLILKHLLLMLFYDQTCLQFFNRSLHLIANFSQCKMQLIDQNRRVSHSIVSSGGQSILGGESDDIGCEHWHRSHRFTKKDLLQLLANTDLRPGGTRPALGQIRAWDVWVGAERSQICLYSPPGSLSRTDMTVHQTLSPAKTTFSKKSGVKLPALYISQSSK